MRARARTSTSRLTASPVVGGGRIFVLDAEAHVYAFDAKNGQSVWDKRLAPKNGTDMPTLWGLLGKPNTIEPVSGMGGGIAYDAGKIFVTSGFGVLIAMDAATGREIWRHDLAVPIVNAPVVNGGRIFFSTHDNHFYALAEADGRTLWDQQGVAESAGILSSTSAAVSGQFVIAPYTSGELFALRVQNGQQAWNDVLSHSGQVTALSELDDIAARPVIDRDMVFAISHSGVMAAIALATGDRAWTRDIGGTQTPWVAGDYVYVLTGDEQLMCLTRKEGRVRWIHQLPQFTDPDGKKHAHRLGRAGAGLQQADHALLGRLCRGDFALYRRAAGPGRNSRRHQHCAGGGGRHALYPAPTTPNWWR